MRAKEYWKSWKNVQALNSPDIKCNYGTNSRGVFHAIIKIVNYFGNGSFIFSIRMNI